MRIDLLAKHDDVDVSRQRRLTVLQDLTGLRSLEVELPLLPDWLPPWVRGVTLPAAACSAQRAAVLDQLRGHASLRELAIRFAVDADATRELQVLAELQQLTHLDIVAPAAPCGGPGRALDLRVLSNLRNLRSLRLYGPVSHVEGLASLTELRELEILQQKDTIWRVFAQGARVAAENGIDLAPLGGLRELRRLALDCVADLGAIEQFPHLEDVSLDHSDVANLSPVRTLGRLRVLSLHDTLVTDLTPLTELPELRELYLGRTPVTDLGPLRACARLERLSLSQSTISDLTPLRACGALEQLDLANAGTTPDLRQLSGMPNLRALSLVGTAVTDLSPLMGCPRLTFFDLEETPLAGQLGQTNAHWALFAGNARDEDVPAAPPAAVSGVRP